MNRQELYGTNFGWYMQDSDGAIALFLSGYGPIPRIVLSDANKCRELESTISHLPDISDIYYTRDGDEVTIDAKNSIFKEVQAVAKGLYVYDNEEYTDAYNLVAIPKVVFRADSPESTISVLLRNWVFSDLKFRRIRSLNLKKYFECE